MTSTASRALPEAGRFRVLRAAALAFALAGAAGAVGLTLYAGRHNNSLILRLIFVVWALAPFVAAAWANVVSIRWPVLTRATLHVLTLVLTLSSLAIYAAVSFGLLKAKIGTIFLLVPVASWLLMAILVPLAAFLSGRLSRRGEGA
jgi:hypothetical protein